MMKVRIFLLALPADGAGKTRQSDQAGKTVRPMI